MKEDDPEIKKGNVFMSCVYSAATHYPDSFKTVASSEGSGLVPATQVETEKRSII